jgi:hypothetical protein
MGANSGLSVCALCDATLKQYQDLTGKTTCKMCDVNNCAAGTNFQPCQNTQNRQCLSCPLTANCLFTNGTGGCTNADGSPTCKCIPGFQITKVNLVYSCTQCPPGKFKSQIDINPCANWTTPACTAGQYAAGGTRTSDSGCVDFPPPPVNAYSTGRLEWGCNAGYEMV